MTRCGICRNWTQADFEIESDHKCLSDEAIRAEITAIDKIHASEEYLNWLHGKEEE
tara:strand:- start:1795 stop:1962 length:168 start_codon:yes stop_codon:yes gene_type:complete